MLIPKTKCIQNHTLGLRYTWRYNCGFYFTL